MHEKRLVSRLQKYWNYLNRKSIYDLPIYDYYDEAVVSDLQHFIAVFSKDCSEQDGRLRYESLGARLQGYFSTNPIGSNVDSRVSKLPGGAIALEAQELINANEFSSPFLKEGEEITEAGKTIKYRNIAMPFTNSTNEGICDVIVGFSWGIFDN